MLINKLCYNFGMEKIFEEFDIELTEKQAEKFEKYYELLIEWNEKFNLTAITERREVYIKHFVKANFLFTGLYIYVEVIERKTYEYNN